MRPVSDAFLRILRGSHVPIFRATLCTTFQTGTAPTGAVLPIADGDVTFDASADIRGSLDMSIPPEYWPEAPSDPLSPYGNEVYIERGLLAGGGQRIFVGLGYYRINSVEQDDVPLGDVRIMGSDRMAAVVDARLEQPVQFGSTATISQVFTQLITEVFPAAVIEYDFDAVGTQLAGPHILDEDRFEFLDDLVTALGKVWYWDYRGVLVVRDAPNPTAPVWQVTHGADGVLVSLSRERNRDGVYNIVVATGEAGTGTPVRAVARDADLNSPTYYLGRFGKVPRFFSSPLLTTQLGAATAAQKLLTRAVGLPYSINFGAVPNPAIEVHDPIYVSYSDNAQSEVHVIERLRLPLSVDGVMTGSTKNKSDLNIEVS